MSLAPTRCPSPPVPPGPGKAGCPSWARPVWGGGGAGIEGDPVKGTVLSPRIWWSVHTEGDRTSQPSPSEGMIPAPRGGGAPAHGCSEGATGPRGAESWVKCRGWTPKGYMPKPGRSSYTARATPKSPHTGACPRGLMRASNRGTKEAEPSSPCVRVFRPLPTHPEGDPAHRRGRQGFWTRWARCLTTRWTGMATLPCPRAAMPHRGVSSSPEPIGAGTPMGAWRTPSVAAGKRSRRRGNPLNEDRISGDNGRDGAGEYRGSQGNLVEGRPVAVWVGVWGFLVLGGGQATGRSPGVDQPRPSRGPKSGACPGHTGTATAVPRPKTGGRAHHTGSRHRPGGLPCEGGRRIE